MFTLKVFDSVLVWQQGEDKSKVFLSKGEVNVFWPQLHCLGVSSCLVWKMMNMSESLFFSISLHTCHLFLHHPPTPPPSLQHSPLPGLSTEVLRPRRATALPVLPVHHQHSDCSRPQSSPPAQDWKQWTYRYMPFKLNLSTAPTQTQMHVCLNFLPIAINRRDQKSCCSSCHAAQTTLDAAVVAIMTPPPHQSNLIRMW